VERWWAHLLHGHPGPEGRSSDMPIRLSASIPKVGVHQTCRHFDSYGTSSNMSHRIGATLLKAVALNCQDL